MGVNTVVMSTNSYTTRRDSPVGSNDDRRGAGQELAVGTSMWSWCPAARTAHLATFRIPMTAMPRAIQAARTNAARATEGAVWPVGCREFGICGDFSDTVDLHSQRIARDVSVKIDVPTSDGGRSATLEKAACRPPTATGRPRWVVTRGTPCRKPDGTARLGGVGERRWIVSECRGNMGRAFAVLRHSRKHEPTLTISFAT